MMRELETKYKTKKILYSTPALLVMCVVVIIFGRGAWGALNKDIDSAKRVDELEAKRNELVARQLELEQGIMRLSTEEGVNVEIRSKFNVTSEGEKFVVLVEPKENQGNASDTPRSFWSRWWGNLRTLFGHESDTK
jgi:cell division protein FtsB